MPLQSDGCDVKVKRKLRWIGARLYPQLAHFLLLGYLLEDIDICFTIAPADLLRAVS